MSKELATKKPTEIVKDKVLNYLNHALKNEMIDSVVFDEKKIMAIAASVAQEYNANPTLRSCTPDSIANAIVTCARWGVRPFTNQNHAVLIPYNCKVKGEDGKETWAKQARPQLQYQGVRFLLQKHHGHELEDYDYLAINEKDVVKRGVGTLDIEFYTGPDKGKVCGYLAYTKIRGVYRHLYMTVSEIEEWRDKYCLQVDYSTKKLSIPEIWVKNFDQMAAKTVFLRLVKKIDLSPELLDIIHDEGKQSENMVNVSPTETQKIVPLGKYIEPEQTAEIDIVDDPMVEIANCQTPEEVDAYAKAYEGADKEQVVKMAKQYIEAMGG